MESSPLPRRSTRRTTLGVVASPPEVASPKVGRTRSKASAPSPMPEKGRRAAASPRPRSQSREKSPVSRTQVTSAKHEQHFEFGGPIGAFGIIFGLPVVCYGLVFVCNTNGCLQLSPFSRPALPDAAIASVYGLLAYLAWFGLCLALHLILPGQYKKGTVLADGSQLTYKLNGLSVLFALLAIATGAWWTGAVSPSLVHDHFLELLTGALVFAYCLSLFLYARSFRASKPRPLLAKGGDTGSAVYDFFIGRELNPRVGAAFDWKEWCELVPGLSLWLILDLAFAAAEYEKTGAVSLPMALVCLFQGMYVVDAVANEPAILTTMDITTDGFGFMLVFGDLVWVPFTYCLQARYILEHPTGVSWLLLAVILALKVGGYIVFRGANGQKDLFRKDPTAPAVAHVKSIQTARGTKLMVSGWWGLARHINYTGDWMMAWAWCLPCGFGSIVPYFYVIYFGVLLVHREMRDEEACRAKYGADWDRYCAIVRFRFFPGIY